MSFVSKLILVLVLAFSGLSFSAPVHADEPPIYTSWRDNHAVGGYDAVSFFTGKPVKGDPTYFFEYKGVIWFFATQRNRNLFISEPAKYEPQYGGYCAWAAAKGKTAKGDPRHFSLREGKLYLNFNARIKARWETDPEGFIAAADKNWPGILSD